MSDLEVVYSEYITEPILEKSKLIVSSGRDWEHVDTDCTDVHIVVQFSLESTTPNGNPAFLKWIFYAQIGGIWVEVKWNDLIEKYKVAIFDAALKQLEWLPFYDQDVLPPWEDSWFTLAALTQA